jgi:hypothetical protein
MWTDIDSAIQHVQDVFDTTEVAALNFTTLALASFNQGIDLASITSMFSAATASDFSAVSEFVALSCESEVGAHHQKDTWDSLVYMYVACTQVFALTMVMTLIGFCEHLEVEPSNPTQPKASLQSHTIVARFCVHRYP